VTSLRVSAAGQVMVLAGEADMTTVRQLTEALGARLAEPATHLTIDISGLCFADASSVRLLAAAAATFVSRGGNLVLTSPQPSVRRMLTLLCLDGTLTIRSDPAAGLGYYET